MLFMSLLDSHPDILMIPGTNLLDYYSFWDRYGHLPLHELLEHFISHYAVIFDARKPHGLFGDENGEWLGLTSMGPNRDQVLTADSSKFREFIHDLATISGRFSSRTFFAAVHIAYHLAIGRDIDTLDNKVIFFQAHNQDAQIAGRLTSDFPNSVFLHTVRNPVQSLFSHIKMYFELNKLTVDTLITCIEIMAFGGIPAIEEYRERCCAVRFEDIHMQPEKTMKAVSDWLGIKWHDNLLSSTFNGIQWWNVIKGPIVSGFNIEAMSRRHEEMLPPFDRYRFQVILRKKYLAWQYTCPNVIELQHFGLLISQPFLLEQFLPVDDDRLKLRKALYNIWGTLNRNGTAEEVQLLDVDRRYSSAFSKNIRNTKI
ncbi:MAG: sulfotransferase [Syntrophobacteraceae bacterium]